MPMMAAASGVPYPVLNDGLHFERSLKEGELLLDLTPPAPFLQVDANIRTIMDSLMTHEFGKTPSTVLMSPPPKHTIMAKKVHMGEFIEKWSYHAAAFRALLKTHKVALTDKNAIIRTIELFGARGAEPWLYSQLRTVSNVVTGIAISGVVLNASSMATGGLQTVHMSNVAENCAQLETLGVKFEALGSQKGIREGYKLYLVVVGYAPTVDMANTGQGVEEWGGVDVRAVASDMGEDYFLGKLVQNSRQNYRRNDSHACAWMHIGTVLTSNQVHVNIQAPWHMADLNLQKFPSTTIDQGNPINNMVAARRPTKRSPQTVEIYTSPFKKATFTYRRPDAVV